MASVGPAGFYRPDYFCDYPPGYMLLCWITGGLMNAFGAFSTSVGQPGLLLVKLWPILFDLAGAALLYLYAKKRLGAFPALFLAALYALNPAALVNGAAWGQADSVLTFFLLLCCVFAMERKWQFAAACLRDRSIDEAAGPFVRPRSAGMAHPGSSFEAKGKQKWPWTGNRFWSLAGRSCGDYSSFLRGAGTASWLAD